MHLRCLALFHDLQAPSGKLTDDMIFEVSRHISDKQTIKKLGLKLRLEMSQIENCINSYGPDHTNMAHEVLNAWLKNQENREKALVVLWGALLDANLAKVAHDVLKPKVPQADLRVTTDSDSYHSCFSSLSWSKFAN